VKIYIPILLLITFLFGQEKVEYEIDVFGLSAAKCIYSVSDTNIYNESAIMINYKVKTIGLYNIFFRVNNNYTIIFKKNTFEFLYYSKKSIQPGVNNYITTNYLDNRATYGMGRDISKNETNIFILLYLLSNNYLDDIKNYPIIDREGKKYRYSLKSMSNNSYSINLEEIDIKDLGEIEHTDIFTWGIFLPKAKNSIFIDSDLGIINKTIFKKGFLKIVAQKVK